MMAKAFIAAQELDLTLLPQSWGLSLRGYRTYFGYDLIAKAVHGELNARALRPVGDAGS